MRILKEAVLSKEDSCPYLRDKQWKQEYFAAAELDTEQFQSFLDQRFRRFGAVFFRPCCPDCRKCLPIRVDVAQFKASRSQRKVLRKNQDTRVVFRHLEPRRELYDIYVSHSRERFNQDCSEDEFLRNFYTPVVPSFQSEYYIGGRLAGFGILDQSSTGLSSVYYCYDPEFSEYSPGTFSVLEEIRETGKRGLDFYYLGYYIAESPKMAYKGRFHPYELLLRGQWSPPETGSR
ncbi:MAG: arginyltransferase [Spirochaetales bacterium]|nr:arginyltransferase [Spirochaetales bacterium]